MKPYSIADIKEASRKLTVDEFEQYRREVLNSRSEVGLGFDVWIVLSQESFIKRASKKHGYKYDYRKVAYKSNSTSVCIICPVHGEFWQRPNNHLNGHGCPACSGHNIRSRGILHGFKILSKPLEIFSDLKQQTVSYYECQCKTCNEKFVFSEEMMKEHQEKHKKI